ncbi:hypothetical protein AB0M22_06505 [Nocardia sp. NPDC051756]|uniref:hypothetical protein n=1 Tax=Nocardia sp. NPDC051756 TaxID=3154751 RepID=UPI003414CDB4
MPAHQRVRTVIVALLGAFAVALGAVTLAAPAAVATPIVTQVDFPFDGLGTDDAPSTPSAPKADDKGKKAENLGGTVTNKVIDLVTGIVKCGLNIASPAVKCSL